MRSTHLSYSVRSTSFLVKKWLFCGSFFMYLSSFSLLPLFYTSKSGSSAIVTTPSAAFIFIVAFFIVVAMRKQKTFYGRGVYVLFTGASLWLLYGWFMSFMGISLYISTRTFRELVALSAFVASLFLVSKILIAYNWKQELSATICLSLGITLVIAYVMNFDNFAFISHIGNIFQSGGRYRYAFGLGHANTAGRYSLLFLIFTSMYREAVAERYGVQKSDKFNTFFLVPVSVVAVLILLSTASRASITSLILFFLVYFYLAFYSSIGYYIRLAIIIASVILVLAVVNIVDWEYVFRESNRMDNYKSIEVIMQRRVIWIGLGFVAEGDLLDAVNLPWQDSFYLTVFIKSGLIGFTILLGSIFWFTKTYFSDIEQMTKFQKLAGGILAFNLYYGLFERIMFGHGAAEMALWALLVSEMSKRSLAKLKIYHRQRKTRMILRKPREIQPSHIA